MQKKCETCSTIIHGRIDKRFCSDQCRNQYHNNRKPDENQYMRKVNYRLRRNRKILYALLKSGKQKMSLSELVMNGFEFSYMTHIGQDEKGGICYYCYEMGYSLKPDGKIHILTLLPLSTRKAKYSFPITDNS